MVKSTSQPDVQRSEDGQFKPYKIWMMHDSQIFVAQCYLFILLEKYTVTYMQGFAQEFQSGGLKLA